MILAQAVLQILCWQGPLWVKCLSQKRGIIQSNIHIILRKVNQVINIIYLNCIINAIVVAQAVLKIFCWQSEKEIIQPNIYRILPKVNQVIYTLDTICEPSHEIMALSVLRKLILQTRMRNHPVALDVWCLVRPFVYFHTSCVRTAKALARLRRIDWAFAGHLCDKYHNLMSWLISWS